MLSPDGACKSFDSSGNGYVRSEAVVAVYLQRAPLAKRIYATVVHSKTNTDGNKSPANTQRLRENALSKAFKTSAWQTVYSI